MERITLKLAETSPLGREGQMVELSLTPTDVRIQEEMATYLAGFKNWQHRADEISPPILVDKDSDIYRNFSSDDTFEPVDVKRSIESAVPEVDARTQTNTYNVVYRFVGSFLNEVTQRNAQNQRYQPRQAGMRRCNRVIGMDRERDAAALVLTNGNWGADYKRALGPGFQWNDGASSNPLRDLQERIEASAQAVTDIWLNQQVANAMLRHPSIRDHIRSMRGDASPDATLAAINQSNQKMAIDFTIPGLPPFHVAQAKWKDPTDGKLKPIFTNSVVLTSNPDGEIIDGETIATTKTFRSRGGAGVGFETREYRVENRGPLGGSMVVVVMADIAVMTANNCGGLIENVIQ